MVSCRWKNRQSTEWFDNCPICTLKLVSGYIIIHYGRVYCTAKYSELYPSHIPVIRISVFFLSETCYRHAGSSIPQTLSMATKYEGYVTHSYNHAYHYKCYITRLYIVTIIINVIVPAQYQPRIRRIGGRVWPWVGGA